VICVLTTTSTDGLDTHLSAITHPYAAAGVLFTMGCISPVIPLTPLQILWTTGNIALRTCLFPMQILVRLLGFMGPGVNKGAY
jgi:hypothetical protein